MATAALRDRLEMNSSRWYAIFNYLAPRMGLTYPRTDLDACTPTLTPVDPLALHVLTERELMVWTQIAQWYTEPGRPIGHEQIHDLIGTTSPRVRLYGPSVVTELEGLGCLLLRGRTTHPHDLNVPDSPKRWPCTTGWPGKPRIVPDPFPTYTGRTWLVERDVSPVECYPDFGTNVVYFLRGIEGGLMYVGSTRDLRVRMNGHSLTRQWAYVEAKECESRGAAYWLEALEIYNRRPDDNRDRYYHDGRIPALLRAPRREKWLLAG